jgi:hypothetical protein
MIIGAASLLFKVFNITEPGNKYVKRNEKKEKQNSKKGLAFILIAILIGLIVFIYWLGK